MPEGAFRWPIVALALAFIAVEAVLLLGADGAFGVPRLRATAINFGAFYPGVVTEGVSNYLGQAWVMFATYGFLHAGIVHLAVNTMTLVSLAPPILDRVGPMKFFALYAGSQIGGGIGSLALGATWIPMVGASGALFGLAGGFIAWEYADRYTASDTLWPVLRAVLILVALNIAMFWVLDGRLAWETHLGGFVAGWILAFVIDPRPRAYAEDEDELTGDGR